MNKVLQRILVIVSLLAVSSLSAAFAAPKLVNVNPDPGGLPILQPPPPPPPPPPSSPHCRTSANCTQP
jgi:hypothetical protein